MALKPLRPAGGIQQPASRSPQTDTDIPIGLADIIQDGLQIWSPEGELRYANPATYQLFGLPPDAPVRVCADLLSQCVQADGNPIDPHAFSIRALAETGEAENEAVFRVRVDEKSDRWLRLRAYEHLAEAAHGTAGFIVSTSFDVTRFVEQERSLQQQAQYDVLTRLPNRLLFADRLNHALATAQRRHETLAVCMMDLDGFKPINDTLGHKAGDRLLQEVAYRLEIALRADDTAARIGGDEFALLLGGLRGPAECEQALNRLLREIARPVMIDGESVAISASIGVSLYPGDIKDPDQLLRHADQAMYKAKESGKGRFHIFDPTVAGKMRASQLLLKKIHHALDAREFLLYYQPKVDCRLGKVIGVEALVRWQHPVLGLRTPGEFLPLIEHDDAIVGLGEWVISEALEQIKRWQAEGLALSVSVNIASRQFLRGNFGVRLGQLLACHPPERVNLLGIEIVETAVLEDINAVSRLIHDYQKEGVKFELDDFGTGYSSLIHLKRLAADALKIDQTFVRDMLVDPGDLTIVQGVINLARAFNLGVVAEGVEGIEHTLTLLELGCDVMQGYGIARPMPAEKVAGWVRDFVPDPRWKVAETGYPNRNAFELLLAKVIHRFWQEQVIAAARDRTGKTPWPELNQARCRLALWYAESGHRHICQEMERDCFDKVHGEAHRLASLLRESSKNGRDDHEALMLEFNQACQTLLRTLERCQS